jgi:hypothetical protein
MPGAFKLTLADKLAFVLAVGCSRRSSYFDYFKDLCTNADGVRERDPEQTGPLSTPKKTSNLAPSGSEAPAGSPLPSPSASSSEGLPAEIVEAIFPFRDALAKAIGGGRNLRPFRIGPEIVNRLQVVPENCALCDVDSVMSSRMSLELHAVMKKGLEDLGVVCSKGLKGRPLVVLFLETAKTNQSLYRDFRSAFATQLAAHALQMTLGGSEPHLDVTPQEEAQVKRPRV